MRHKLGASVTTLRLQEGGGDKEKEEATVISVKLIPDRRNYVALKAVEGSLWVRLGYACRRERGRGGRGCVSGNEEIWLARR